MRTISIIFLLATCIFASAQPLTLNDLFRRAQAPGVNTNGLVAQWNLAANLNDSVGANNLTAYSTASYVSNAFVCNGNNGTHLANCAPLLNAIYGAGESFSISLWFNLNSTSDVGKTYFVAAMIDGSNPAEDEIQIYYRISNSVFYLGDSISGGTLVGEHARTLTAGWHNFSLTWDGNNLTQYLDGAGQTDSIIGLGLSNSATYLDIGTRNWMGYVQGLISNVRIWNRALPSSEITTSYSLGRQ